MKTFRRLIGLPGIQNFGWVMEGKLACSSQPDYDLGAGQTLVGLGIKYIIDLSGDRIDQGYAEEFGFVVEDRTMSEVVPPDIDYMKELTRHMTDLIAGRYGILFHCKFGQDRTGYLRFCWRILVSGWTFTEAMEEMLSYIHNINFEIWPGINARLNDLKHYTVTVRQ